MLNAANWTARLNELATEANVPGAALGIWSDGQEILAAHGVLNAATQVLVTTDSVFQVGSITKLWTATMIMQLVDEGLLSLDTTVSEVLPGARLGAADVGGQVTVRHLLTHTSGIDGDVFTDTGRGDDCVERYVGLLAEVPSVFAPGATYSYCNSGYVLLGRIIEVIDGQSWDESLRERLTGPLAATQTVTLPEEAILRRAAVGHHRDGTPVHVWGLPRSVGPAGLITATAGDLLTFARLHLDGGITADGKRLLSEVSVAAMQSACAAIPEFSRLVRPSGWAGASADGVTGRSSATAECLVSLCGQPDQRPPPVGRIVLPFEQPLAFQVRDDLADHRLRPGHVRGGLPHGERAGQRQVLDAPPWTRRAVDCAARPAGETSGKRRGRGRRTVRPWPVHRSRHQGAGQPIHRQSRWIRRGGPGRRLAAAGTPGD